jgi:CBS domain containing-hemolysin-like protein/mannitol/fructose-specific phosphotransferase system IIA component
MFGDLGLAIVALVLLAANAFFVLAEFAIVKVRASRLEELAEHGVKNARIARDIISRLDAYLAATQIGITLASLALGWIGQPAFAGLIQHAVELPGWLSTAASHTVALVASFAVLTFLHLLVAELLPRFVAIQHAEATALFVARPLWLFRKVIALPQRAVHAMARWMLRLFRVPMTSEAEVTYSEEELRSILGASQERGGFSFHHLLLLENAFDFGELRVGDVAVPLESVAFLDPSRPWPENAAAIAERRLSRYPLREGERGKILGVVHVKSILGDLLAGRTPDLRALARKVARVPSELLLEVALRKLQKSGEHMAAAVDEAGHVIGIFTLEDVVEELIGDVRDEFEAARLLSLSEILPTEAILLDPPVADRAELVAALVSAACRGVEGVDPAVAVDAVMRREKAVPASIGALVAVPHARVPGLKEPRAAFARLRRGVDYQAPDGRPVKIALLVLTPLEAARGAQARALRRTAGLMQSDYLRARLLDADSPEEVREIFRIGETSAAV